jgi:hypothetical protein
MTCVLMTPFDGVEASSAADALGGRQQFDESFDDGALGALVVVRVGVSP